VVSWLHVFRRTLATFDHSSEQSLDAHLSRQFAVHLLDPQQQLSGSRRLLLGQQHDLQLRASAAGGTLTARSDHAAAVRLR
jgi:hypothetical protein